MCVVCTPSPAAIALPSPSPLRHHFQLDAHEFGAAAAEMGFAAVAHQVFGELDKNISGSISYREFTEKLVQNVPSDPDTKKLLTALMWSWDAGTKEETKRALDTRNWQLKGTDAESVTAELRELLRQNGGHVAVRSSHSAACTYSFAMPCVRSTFHARSHYVVHHCCATHRTTVPESYPPPPVNLHARVFFFAGSPSYL